MNELAEMGNIEKGHNNFIIIYRKASLPAIYCKIPFLRRSTRLFVDCPDDLNEIVILQKASKGKLCISELEGNKTFVVAVSFPDKILHLKGETNEAFEYLMYTLRLWDVSYYLKGTHPSEAIEPIEEGLDSEKIEMLAAAKSCLPFLHELEKTFIRKQSFPSQAEEMEIEEVEKRIFAGLKIRHLKGVLKSQKLPKNQASFRPKDRERILRRDKYKCIFCGTPGSVTQLEVNHIIPRSTIKKLNLNDDLFSIDYNLITACFPCNRGKSDHLRTEDIELYFKLFAEPKHSNHKLLEFLKLIKGLQEL